MFAIFDCLTGTRRFQISTLDSFPQKFCHLNSRCCAAKNLHAAHFVMKNKIRYMGHVSYLRQEGAWIHIQVALVVRPNLRVVPRLLALSRLRPRPMASSPGLVPYLPHCFLQSRADVSCQRQGIQHAEGTLIKPVFPWLRSDVEANLQKQLHVELAQFLHVRSTNCCKIVVPISDIIIVLASTCWPLWHNT